MSGDLKANVSHFIDNEPTCPYMVPGNNRCLGEAAARMPLLTKSTA